MMDNNEVAVPNSDNSFLAGSIQQEVYRQYYGSVLFPRPNYLTEDLMSGLRRNGRMSVVRRFFCLFVTFDLLFTSLMWLICLVLVGNFDFYKVFESQIVHYSIYTSLFDIVMAALVRFTALILFYALLHINHWIIVAVTTAGTCLFLLFKVYLFNWSVSSQPVLQVLLILSSFIICWAEAWFLDLRVISQERHAREYLNASIVNDRSPLLQSFLHANSRFDTLSESVGTFYSPVESSEDSGNEGERSQRRRTKQIITNEMMVQYREMGEETLDTAWSILSNGLWSLEKDTSEGDKIMKQKLSKGHGTLFYFIGDIATSSNILFDILYKNIESVAAWNPTIKESKIVQVVDDSTDICYQLTAEAGGGVITSRDFVILRHWQKKYGHTIIANVSVNCPLCLPNNRYIRGENGPGCWAIKDIPSEENKCQLHWLVNTNIKGWLPQYAVNSSLTGVMLEYITFLRKHVDQLKITS